MIASELRCYEELLLHTFTCIVTWHIILVQVMVSGRQTEVILSNLLADSEYSVIVTAISNTSPGPPSPAVTVRTLPGKSTVILLQLLLLLLLQFLYSMLPVIGQDRRRVPTH